MIGGSTEYYFPEDGKKEVIVTTTYRNTSNVYLKEAKTWCMDFKQEATLSETKIPGEENLVEYEENSDFEQLIPEENFTLIYSNEDSWPSVSLGAVFHLIEIYRSSNLIPYSTKTDIEKYEWTIDSSLTEKSINYDKFLGTWKNDTGEYYLGAKYKEDGIEVKYNPPDSNRKTLTPAKEICDASEQNIDLLISTLAKHENTQTHEELMKYYWNIYVGKNVYDIDIDELLDLFNTEVMIPISGSTSSSINLLKEYIRYWEGAPMNADGTKYVIYDDGAGNLTVGYGVNIYGGGFASDFENAGYIIEEGTEVDIEFVDGLEERALNEKIKEVEDMTSGLNLKEYQIHALVSRAYNCGSSGAIATERGQPKLNFIDSYKEYWNEETDDLFEQKTTEADLSHELYQQYMSKPVTQPGHKPRRESEWILFQTGYYSPLDKWYQEGVDKIISIADEIHRYMEENGYTYCVYGSNRLEECQKYGKSQCGLNTTFEASKTGFQNTCCATYVSWVLQEAGYITEEEHRINYLNGADEMRNFLQGKGWTEITREELQPGDILCYSEHVEIYAGDGKVYNAGSGESIRGTSPEPSWSLNNKTLICGLRVPN